MLKSRPIWCRLYLKVLSSGRFPLGLIMQRWCARVQKNKFWGFWVPTGVIIKNWKKMPYLMCSERKLQDCHSDAWMHLNLTRNMCCRYVASVCVVQAVARQHRDLTGTQSGHTSSPCVPRVAVSWTVVSDYCLAVCVYVAVHLRSAQAARLITEV